MTLITILTLALSVAALLLSILALVRTYELERAARRRERAKALDAPTGTIGPVSYTPTPVPVYSQRRTVRRSVAA